MLDTGDASILATKLPGTRSREVALVALANYAKFTGRYERFKEIKKMYDLKWSTSNSTQFFERFFDEQTSLDSMISKIREMIRVLPVRMAAVIRFACLVGLRASEAVESVRLLNVNLVHNYYNPQRQALEHFRFPEIFLRQTKKAYISFLSTDNYHYFANLGCKPPTLNAITLACRRKGIKMYMHLTRKIFASHLIKSGIQSEFVNLLQGRVDSDILTRHYLCPSDTLKSDVLRAVSNLAKLL